MTSLSEEIALAIDRGIALLRTTLGWRCLKRFYHPKHLLSCLWVTNFGRTK